LLKTVGREIFAAGSEWVSVSSCFYRGAMLASGIVVFLDRGRHSPVDEHMMIHFAIFMLGAAIGIGLGSLL
jgi:hypothetical protein